MEMLNAKVSTISTTVWKTCPIMNFLIDNLPQHMNNRKQISYRDLPPVKQVQQISLRISTNYPAVFSEKSLEIVNQTIKYFRLCSAHCM